MANVKHVMIEGLVPFNWAMHDSPLDASDMLFLGSWFLTPSSGLKLTFSDHAVLYHQNADGGQTAYYAFEIKGDEAISWVALQTLVQTLQKAGAVVEKSRAIDIEDISEWQEI